MSNWRKSLPRPAPKARAQSELFTARRRARQQQVREVHTNNQQNHADRAPEHDQRAAQLSGNEILKAADCRGPVAPPVPVGGCDLRREHVDFSLSRFHGDTWPQTAHDSQRVPPIAKVIHDRRNKDVHPEARREYRTEIEGGRNDADNRDRLLVQQDRLARNRRIAGKLAAPESVAQQGGWPTPFLAFFADKQAAQLGLHAQGLKKSCPPP